MITWQEIFETVAKALLKQKKRSVATKTTSQGEKIESCMYRSPDGLKCAIGHLIDDRDYKPEMEGKTVPRLLNDFNFEHSPAIFNADQIFLVELQMIHDRQSVGHWRRELIKFGKRYYLNVDFIDNL